MYTVYLRTNTINEKQYVGQTSNFTRRNWDWNTLSQHYANNFLAQERNKYGLENFKTEILAEVETQEEAWELEKKFIKELNTKVPNGYNMTDGGDGVNGLSWSEESKRKQSEKSKGRHPSEETRKKMSKSHSGEKHWNYGRHWSDEYKRKQSRLVLQIDKNTNEVIAEFPSTMEVERQLGFNHSYITRCCNGFFKQAYGFKWSYL